MYYDPTLKAGLTGAAPGVFSAIEIVHPAQTLRLLDGGGFLTLDGHSYRGDDANYGRLGGCDLTEDGVGDQQATATVTIIPPNMAAAVTLASPAGQGAVVTVRVGAFNPATGAATGVPLVLFSGEVDVISLSQAGVVFQCVGALERFFEDDQAARLVNAKQQELYPGDRGAEYVTDVTQQMPWGAEGQRPGVITVTATPAKTNTAYLQRTGQL